MAKIILVSVQLHQTSWSLARALTSQGHEVTVLTSKDQPLEFDTRGIVVMSYFHSWNLLEALKIIPAIFAMSPQILHFLLDSDSMNIAQSALALFAKGNPTCILTTSLLHIRRGLHKKNPVRYLLQQSDIVTCPTLETMAHLRGLSAKRSQGRGILPPVLDLSDELKSHQSEVVLSELPLLELLAGQAYIVVPFREFDFKKPSLFKDRLRVLASKYHVVLWGSSASWSPRERKQLDQWMHDEGLADRWTLTGSISSGTTESLLESCEALWLAGQDFTPIEMTEFYLKAINTHCSLVLSRRQAQVHAALWQHGRNCWILEDRKLQNEVIQLLKNESLKTPEGLPQSIARERHWIDVPLNDLNRLYNKALLSK